MSGETQTRVGFESIEWINKRIHWLDEFILAISTLLVGVALILAFADLGTGGLVFQNNSLLVGWGVAVALGVESQLRALVRRAFLAFKDGSWLRGIGWSVIALLIIAVSVIAMVIFSTEKMLHLSEQQALDMVGISAVTYAQARAILTIALAVISGFAAYEMRVAKPDTESELAQIKHESTLLPEQIKLDALRAQRAEQADTLRVRRGVGLVKTAANEIRKPKEDQGMAVVAASYERVVDADDPTDDDDDPTPTPPTNPRGPQRGSRSGENSITGMALVPAGPRNPGRQGRPSTAQVVVPPMIAGMEYARPTGPLGDKRVDAAKEIIAAAPNEMKLRELASAINAVLTDEKKLSDSNASKIRNVAFQELAREGKLPEWAEQFVVRTAA